MSYYIIAFKAGQDPKRVWIRTEEQVHKLLEEGYSVYRTSTDQVPVVIIGETNELTWKDAKTEG